MVFCEKIKLLPSPRNTGGPQNHRTRLSSIESQPQKVADVGLFVVIFIVVFVVVIET